MALHNIKSNPYILEKFRTKAVSSLIKSACSAVYSHINTVAGFFFSVQKILSSKRN